MKRIRLLLFGVVLGALLATPGAAMARSRDRDHDKLPDKWEKKFHLSTHTKNAKGDPDHDGLNNLREFRDGTNPRRADTDGDGVNDGDEMAEHTNPRDADTDNDGVRDGEETIGTVAGFTEDSPGSGTGVLTITLNDGSSESGRVDQSARIECRAPEQAGRHDRDGGGDNSGPGRGDGDHGGPGRGGDERSQCSTADLTANTPVHEAELHGSGDSAVFEKVELIK